MIRLIGALMAIESAGAACAQSCDQLTKFKIPGTELTIAEAESVAAGSAQGVSLPAYCRVDGTIDPRTGVGGKLRRSCPAFLFRRVLDWRQRSDAGDAALSDLFRRRHLG